MRSSSSSNRLTQSCVVLTVLSIGVLLIAGEACLDPTQVTVDIRYQGGSCKEVKNVVVMVGNDPRAVEGRANEASFYPTAITQNCEANGQIGTLVLTPSDASDRAAVMVIAGLGIPAETCKAINGYLGCIVARRQLTFVKNRPLVLPIVLERTCVNVPCNELSSCRDGRCVESETRCIDGTECTDYGATVVTNAPTRPPDTSGLCKPASKEIACNLEVCKAGDACCYSGGYPITSGSIKPRAPGDIEAGTSSGGGTSASSSGMIDSGASSSGTSGTSSGTSGTSSSSSSSGASSSGTSSSGTSGTGTSGTSGVTSSGGNTSSSSSGGGLPPPANCGPTCPASSVRCMGKDNCTTDAPFCCISGTVSPSTACQATECAPGFTSCHENCDCPEGQVCESKQIAPGVHRCVSL